MIYIFIIPVLNLCLNKIDSENSETNKMSLCWSLFIFFWCIIL